MTHVGSDCSPSEKSWATSRFRRLRHLLALWWSHPYAGLFLWAKGAVWWTVSMKQTWSTYLPHGWLILCLLQHNPRAVFFRIRMIPSTLFKLALITNLYTFSMAHRPRVSPGATSTNDIPKAATTTQVVRGASYPAPAHCASPRTTTTQGVNGQSSQYRQQLKAAPTELLIDARAAINAKAGKSLQNLLMDTERRLREQRRVLFTQRLQRATFESLYFTLGIFNQIPSVNSLSRDSRKST